VGSRRRTSTSRSSPSATTVYVSPKDTAIGLSEAFNRSKRRLGRLDVEDIKPAHRQRLADVDKVDIVEARVKADAFGHSYYHANPAVSSDLLLLIRYGAEPGSPERPLREIIPNYWLLDDEAYPFVEERRQTDHE
jgi:esterase/lipase superfamily enzyme